LLSNGETVTKALNRLRPERKNKAFKKNVRKN